jgi:hypothetical protein
MTFLSGSTGTNMSFKPLQPPNSLAGLSRSRPKPLKPYVLRRVSLAVKATKSTLRDSVRCPFLGSMPSNVPHKEPSANTKLDKLGVGAATTGSSLPSLSKSKERKETSTPRKSLETKAKETVKKDKVDSGSASSSDIERKDKKSKSRSQSRKRSSIFGLLGNKKEEQEVKKEEKAEEKAEKQHDNEIAKDEKKHAKDVAKEHHHHDKDVAKEEKKHEKEIAKEEHKHEKELTKEEKKLEKEEKQAEAKASHQPSDIAEAGAATVVAAGEYSVCTLGD